MPVLYASAIALQLAKPCSQHPLVLANAIAEQFPSGGIVEDVREHQELERGGFILRNFTVKVEPSGWLYFELDSLGLVTWLQWLIQISKQFSFQERDLITSQFALERTSSNSSVFSGSHVFDSFTVQYAHARCCSLLRLAQVQTLGAERLSNTDDPSQPSAIAQLIPWLNPQGELRFMHPTEHRLIFTLIDTVDELNTLSVPAIAQSPTWQSRVEKLATALAHTFLNFYDTCRFWGEVQQQDPNLLEARLGLVLAVQPLLGSMLQELLGLPAPTEL